jgi:hypothetical protein
MKKSLVAAIIGLATVASTFGQGQILISNYANAPYNQVYWNPATASVGNQALLTSQNVTLSIWYGLGTISDANLLTQGNVFSIDNTISVDYDPGAGHGAGGYYINQTQVIPGWSSGVVTFQVRASGVSTLGLVTGSSALWQETPGSTASPAPNSLVSQGFAVTVVPEPSTFALAGLGSAALLIFRRRKA